MYRTTLFQLVKYYVYFRLLGPGFFCASSSISEDFSLKKEQMKKCDLKFASIDVSFEYSQPCACVISDISAWLNLFYCILVPLLSFNLCISTLRLLSFLPLQ